MSNAQDEYRARMNRERDKALAKYGEAGLEPAGNPELDVLDYLINEVVGLNRYGEILFNKRVEWPVEFRHRAAVLANRLREFSAEMGYDLIGMHQGLRNRVDMGKGENDETS